MLERPAEGGKVVGSSEEVPSESPSSSTAKHHKPLIPILRDGKGVMKYVCRKFENY
ncbi:MAG: hypothetical protein QME25_01580 [Bacteroidota bacterium]|nr:hypothetical protein [Bacteroidota bacterium]